MRQIVAGIVSYLVLILVALIIVSNLLTSTSRSGWAAEANTTWTNLSTYIWIAFGLLAIVPLILVAGYMIAIMSWGGGKGA
jgi:nitrogen fixation/metabolism regulation signal transduction histidine kinase